MLPTALTTSHDWAIETLAEAENVPTEPTEITCCGTKAADVVWYAKASDAGAAMALVLPPVPPLVRFRLTVTLTVEPFDCSWILPL